MSYDQGSRYRMSDGVGCMLAICIAAIIYLFVRIAQLTPGAK